MEDNSLFELVGGRPILEQVHKLFYDKLYAHPWLKKFFVDVDQKIIEDQQTDFMTSNMGGGKIFSGSLPEKAHKHIYITNDMFNLRQSILKECILETGLSDDFAERWMKIDEAFRKSIVKEDVDQCQKRFRSDEILFFPNSPS